MKNGRHAFHRAAVPSQVLYFHMILLSEDSQISDSRGPSVTINGWWERYHKFIALP